MDIATVLSNYQNALVHADREMLQINCGAIDGNYSKESFPHHSDKYRFCHSNYIVFSDGSVAWNPDKNTTKNIEIPQKYSSYGGCY